jgi:hypothetical protein
MRFFVFISQFSSSGAGASSSSAARAREGSEMKR